MHALAVVLATALAAHAADDVDDEAEGLDEPARRLSLVAWGGQAIDVGGTSRSGGPFAGAEVAWAFDAIEVGVQGSAIRLKATPEHDWSPVLLGRLTERFQTGSGVEASFTFGFGAGRTDRWVGWYQVAVGVRVGLGAAFLAGEVSLEQYDLARFGLGLGVRL